MSQFPRNARTGQTHKKYGRKYVYSETTETWSPIVPLASKAEIKRAAAVASSATTFYATAAELPLSNNTTGALAFVSETNRLYVWSGTGWYNIATISSAGSSITGAASTYTLATNGTPTVITLNQIGLTSPTWSYEVTSGSIGRTATVTQADNVFTFTPSTNKNHLGSFSITFTATDGSNTLVASSSFTLNFNPQLIREFDIGSSIVSHWNMKMNSSYLVLGLSSQQVKIYDRATGSLVTTLYNPNSNTTDTTDDFGQNLDISETYLAVTADREDGTNTNLGVIYIYEVGTWNLLYTLQNPAGSQTSQNNNRNWGDSSIKINGDYLAVAVNGWSNYRGIVRIMDLTTGAQVASVVNPNFTTTNDYYGEDLIFADDILIIGANGEDTSGNQSGTIYFYSWDAVAKTTTLVSTKAPGQFQAYAGRRMAYDGTYIYATAWRYAPDQYAGQVFKYTKTGGLVATIDDPNIYNVSLNDRFGDAITVTSNYLVVSNREGYGTVFLYDLSTLELIHTLSSPVRGVPADTTTQTPGFGRNLSGYEDTLMIYDDSISPRMVYQYKV